MAIEDTTLVFFSALAPQIPRLLVYVAGIGWAIYRWKEMPRPALLLTIGLVLLTLLAFLSTGSSIVPEIIVSHGGSPGDVAPVVTSLACISALVASIATGLVIWAVFADRGAEIGY